VWAKSYLNRRSSVSSVPLSAEAELQPSRSPTNGRPKGGAKQQRREENDNTDNKNDNNLLPSICPPFERPVLSALCVWRVSAAGDKPLPVWAPPRGAPVCGGLGLETGRPNLVVYQIGASTMWMCGRLDGGSLAPVWGHFWAAFGATFGRNLAAAETKRGDKSEKCQSEVN